MIRHRSLLVAAALTLGGTGAHAAEPGTKVDLEFLEFLGSLDAEEEDWREYLAERPIASEAGKPVPKADGKPEAPGAEKPAPKQDKVNKP